MILYHGSYVKIEKPDLQHFLNRLRYEKPNMQICLRSDKALEYLSFEGSERI